MEIKNMYYEGDLLNVVQGIRTCWQSFDKSDSTEDCIGQKDLELVDRIGNKMKHTSTLVHSTFTFDFEEDPDPVTIIQLLENKYLLYDCTSKIWTINLRTLKEFCESDVLYLNEFSDAVYKKLSLPYQLFLKECYER